MPVRFHSKWRKISFSGQATVSCGKAWEAYFTVGLEAFWTKRRILEVYLNVAEICYGIFGVAVASQHFFHKPEQHSMPRRLPSSLPCYPTRGTIVSRLLRGMCCNVVGVFCASMERLGGLQYLRAL